MTQAMTTPRVEHDSLGPVDVPSDKLWGAQTQRSLEHFSIGTDLIPSEMISAYAILKKAAAHANHAAQRLDDQRHTLIVQVCDEILAGQLATCFRCTVDDGIVTQFTMKRNEVISNAAVRSPVPATSKAPSPQRPREHSQSSTTRFLSPCTSRRRST